MHWDLKSVIVRASDVGCLFKERPRSAFHPDFQSKSKSSVNWCQQIIKQCTWKWWKWKYTNGDRVYLCNRWIYTMRMAINFHWYVLIVTETYLSCAYQALCDVLLSRISNAKQKILPFHFIFFFSLSPLPSLVSQLFQLQMHFTSHHIMLLSRALFFLLEFLMTIDEFTNLAGIIWLWTVCFTWRLEAEIKSNRSVFPSSFEISIRMSSVKFMNIPRTIRKTTK